jgi:hypothetical protein
MGSESSPRFLGLTCLFLSLIPIELCGIKKRVEFSCPRQNFQNSEHPEYGGNCHHNFLSSESGPKSRSLFYLGVKYISRKGS